MAAKWLAIAESALYEANSPGGAFFSLLTRGKSASPGEQPENGHRSVHGVGHIRSTLTRIRFGLDKVRWGARAVGLPATARGIARFASVLVRRPDRTEIRLSSGTVIEYDYPSQFSPALVLFGDFIDPEFAFLREVHGPNWVFADVGAAIGQFTLFAAALPAATVHAFEPSGVNVATLRRNLARNGVADKVNIHQIALSSTDGVSAFSTTERTWVSHLSDRTEPGDEIVQVRTLSGEFKRLGISHVSVLKVNVAGHEPAVLEGAATFLAEGRADILILLLGLASLPWYAKLAADGYRFFYYHPVEHSLYEITAFDQSSVLDSRPWPARHIIGIHCAAISASIGSSIRIRQARATI